MINDKDLAQANFCGGSPAKGEIYRNYKGGLYTVIARAIKEDTLEPLVIYSSNANGTIWARTLNDFNLQILDDKPRFMRIRE